MSIKQGIDSSAVIVAVIDVYWFLIDSDVPVEEAQRSVRAIEAYAEFWMIHQPTTGVVLAANRFWIFHCVPSRRTFSIANTAT